jgi:hypothetical protein
MLGALLLVSLAGMTWAEQAAAPATPSCCQKMQERRERMATLEAKVKTMNVAQGPEKIEAIAAVVNELVTQRHATHGSTTCPGGCAMMGGEGAHHGTAGGPTTGEMP